MEYKIVTAGKDTLLAWKHSQILVSIVNEEIQQGWTPQGNPFMDSQGYLSQALVRTIDAKFSTGNKERVETNDSNDT